MCVCARAYAAHGIFQRVPSRGINLGTSVIGRASPELHIAHIFGQEFPGPNTDLAAVDSALADLAATIARSPDLSPLPVYVPHLMGCGLGGGDWDAYASTLQRYFPDITIVQRPCDAPSTTR